jgi:hypothetical protein
MIDQRRLSKICV